MKMLNIVCRTTLAATLWSLAGAIDSCNGAMADFVIEDFLGRTWTNEVVEYPLTPEQTQSVKSAAPLVDADGTVVPYQQIMRPGEAGPRLAFQANVSRFSKSEYRFATAQAPGPATDLTVDEPAGFVRLLNSSTGILLRTKLEGGAGPIAGVRLNSGKWIGDSLFKSQLVPSTYTVEVTAQGPVYAEAICRAEFADGRSWRLRVRLEAHEPVVLVDEDFSLADESTFVLLASSSWNPDQVLFRRGQGQVGTFESTAIDATGEVVFALEPWVRWWMNDRQGKWFGLYESGGSDLFTVAAFGGDAWVDPTKPRIGRPVIPFVHAGNSIDGIFPLTSGQRRWLLAALPKSESMTAIGQADLEKAPLPQQYLIKHGDFPLNVVKDYVLTWDGDDHDHPRLIVTQPQVSEFRKNFKANPNTLEYLTRSEPSQYQLDGPIQYYFGTGDAKLGTLLGQTTLKWLQEAVDTYTQQLKVFSFGYGPHHQARLLTSLNLADSIWSTELDPEQRRRAKAQVAFLGYTVSRPDYWSSARGLSANPNMTTTVAAFQAAVAAMIPSHPMARTWMEGAMHELKDQLDHWSDANGGWLEAPHYAMVSYDYLLGIFLMAHNAGLNENLYDPKIKDVIHWFAKIATPPDSRLLNRRHHPCIGNTYWGEGCGEFGLVASLWKDKDPAFAAEMQWMQQQQGSLHEPGTGGFFPTLAGYRGILMDPAIAPQVPHYGSELFPKTGAVLRNHAATDRETQLLLIAGHNHQHYDLDSGSVTLWGKGRIVADDFGYGGQTPGEDHNMVVASAAPDGAIFHVSQFVAGPQLDYLAGSKQNWSRQIVLVKDAEIDPLAPNYFVLRDSFAEPDTATWRLWLTAVEVRQQPHGALAIGAEDIDTDLFFVRPDVVRSTTESKTRESPGISAEGNYSKISRTQLGLIVPLEGDAGLTTVVFPRLKAQKPPRFSTIADGNGVIIESDAGTDYVFLAAKPCSFQDNLVNFQGTVGAVQVRGAKTYVSLGAPGKVIAKGHTLEKK